jgi:hypothetical protein
MEKFGHFKSYYAQVLNIQQATLSVIEIEQSAVTLRLSKKYSQTKSLSGLSRNDARARCRQVTGKLEMTPSFVSLEEVFIHNVLSQTTIAIRHDCWIWQTKRTNSCVRPQVIESHMANKEKIINFYHRLLVPQLIELYYPLFHSKTRQSSTERTEGIIGFQPTHCRQDL